jgi:predicted nucleic acid-binding protein
LRSAYGLTADEIADGLSGLAGLPGVSVEDPAVLAATLEQMRGGMDFADALHLAKSAVCAAFLTFDRKLAKAAKSRSATPVESL